jgi:type II secretory ATPase GspE/PulE/Tfp pilus assembly ATPase PilB-like protein
MSWGAGAAGVVGWVLLPWFWIGLALFVVLFGAAIAHYAFTVYNPRVPPTQAILTPAHFKRLGKPKEKGAGAVVSSKKVGGSNATPASDASEKVRLKGANGKTPAWPTAANERAAYQALQDLVFEMIWRRAAMVRMDLVPQQPLKIVYRIDGFERAREPIAAEAAPLVFRLFKQIAGMDPEEHRRPQPGRFKASIGAGEVEQKVDFDAKSSGSTAGQRMTMRLLTESARFRPPALGLTKGQLATVEQFVGETRGVVVCSGPKDSGLTSTLYAILRTHDAFMQHIHTLEINKDMDLENVTQHVYDGQASGVTFGKKFKSVLRSEPDICMAGDMPDAETATSAAAAARAGKKLYLGMAAKDTFDALRRYLEGVGDNALAASGLVGVINQRLIRILCTACRKGYKPDPKLLKKGNLPMDENRPFYRPPNPGELATDKQGNPAACPVCQGTGYVGRTGVFEVLPLDKELKALIAKGTPLATVKVEARKKGLLYVQEVALRKVYEGITSINEVLRVTKDETAPAATKG